jgi:chromosomal replication initiator protein
VRHFDDTVIGASNRLAFESARAVADGREQSMRMLFLHGRCGVGKTHLLQAIACRRREVAPAARIRYLTGEQFTNEYITAVREGGLEGFRRRIRRQHLLVIDDIHFLASKTATQTEFQHTVDEIALAGGAVVLAADGHPRHMQRIGAGLVSRFMSGMVVRIDEPDHAMRGQLAQRFAALRGLVLSDAAVSLLADRVTGSVRDIEGAVSALAALRLVTGRGSGGPIGPGHVTEALGAGLPTLRGRPARIGEIIEACCIATGVSREDLMGGSRHRRVVAARGLIAHLAREMTTMSFPEIALALGRPTHSTVHAAAARFRAAMERGESVPCADGDRPAADVADHARREVGRVPA